MGSQHPKMERPGKIRGTDSPIGTTWSCQCMGQWHGYIPHTWFKCHAVWKVQPYLHPLLVHLHPLHSLTTHLVTSWRWWRRYNWQLVHLLMGDWASGRMPRGASLAQDGNFLMGKMRWSNREHIQTSGSSGFNWCFSWVPHSRTHPQKKTGADGADISDPKHNSRTVFRRWWTLQTHWEIWLCLWIPRKTHVACHHCPFMSLLNMAWCINVYHAVGVNMGKLCKLHFALRWPACFLGFVWISSSIF